MLKYWNNLPYMLSTNNICFSANIVDHMNKYAIISAINKLLIGIIYLSRIEDEIEYISKFNLK